MIKLKKLIREMHDSDDSAGVCLYFSGKLLSCKRTDSYWSVPKGHIHKGEDPKEGAVREFYEETKIHLDDDLELVLTGDNKDGGKFYLYKYDSNQRHIPQLDYEHEAWRYFDVNNLPYPFDKSVLEYLK